MDYKDFDFDQWMKLAKENPEEFEAKRLAAIESIIDEAPVEQKRRLRGLQFQIDAHRGLAKSEVDAMLKVSRMMHESFQELRFALNEMTGQFQAPVQDMANSIVTTEMQEKTTAKVLPFRQRA